MVKFEKKPQIKHFKQKFMLSFLNCLKWLTSSKTSSLDDQLEIDGSDINDSL